jgi:hypothetical protein
VIILLVLALAWQWTPDVEASVSRTHVTVGEEVVLTVRVRSPSSGPVRIDVPVPAGFALAGSRELTDVTLSQRAQRLRTTVRELRLRAERPGRAMLAGIRVHDGERIVAVDAIALDVAAVANAEIACSDAVRARAEQFAPAGDTVQVAPV